MTSTTDATRAAVAAPGGGARARFVASAGAAAIIAGLVLTAVLIARDAPTAARAGDRLVTIATPVLTEGSLRSLRADLERLEATGAALRGPGLRQLAAEAGASPGEFVAELAARHPTFAAGVARLPSIEAQAERIVGNLERRRGAFVDAASLPGPGFDLRGGVAAGFALAAVLVVLGAVAIVRRARMAAVALLVIGAAMVAGPLVLRYPSKTSRTDALLDSLRPFSVEKVRDRQASLATVRSVLAGFRGEVVPAVASAAGTTPAAILAELARVDPDLTASAFRRVDAGVERFGFLVDFSERIQPLLVDAGRLPARTTLWILLVPGVALVVLAAPGVRPRPSPVSGPH